MDGEGDGTDNSDDDAQRELRAALLPFVPVSDINTYQVPGTFVLLLLYV